MLPSSLRPGRQWKPWTSCQRELTGSGDVPPCGKMVKLLKLLRIFLVGKRDIMPRQDFPLVRTDGFGCGEQNGLLGFVFLL